LQGARQTGKTWLLKYFGSNFYESVSYFNFKKQTELGQFFETNKNPERIIENLSLVDGKPILPGKSLIIFDEIQESNNALNSLKYFNEEAPGYHIACAGSLLGAAMSKGSSFPAVMPRNSSKPLSVGLIPGAYPMFHFPNAPVAYLNIHLHPFNSINLFWIILLISN